MQLLHIKRKTSQEAAPRRHLPRSVSPLCTFTDSGSVFRSGSRGPAVQPDGRSSFLPLHVVQVARHAQSSDGVELPVVHQAVVSAAGHRHPRHQVPVVQQRHVAPDVGHHHTRLGAACEKHSRVVKGGYGGAGTFSVLTGNTWSGASPGSRSSLQMFFKL